MLHRVLALTLLGAPALVVLPVLPVLSVLTAPSFAATPTCHGRAATIVGTPGDDELVGTRGPDVVVARGGDDRIQGLGGDDVICGGPGADQLAGGPGDDLLDVGARPPHARTVDDGDIVTYAASAHAVSVDLHARTAVGEGHDRIVRVDRIYVEGSGHDDVLRGSSHRETLDGAGGDDRLAGRGGRDTLIDHGGDDLLAGGAGRDLILSYAGADTIQGGRGFDWLVAVSTGPAEVHGGRGFDYIDRQFTWGDNGLIDGGPGSGQIELNPLTRDTPIMVDVPGGTATGTRSGRDIATVDFTDVHAFTLWGDGPWTFLGSEGPDFFQVLEGPVDAHTLGGDDEMLGGEDDDLLDGGDGTDTAWGDGGTNTCVDTERGDCDGPWDPAHPRAARTPAALITPATTVAGLVWTGVGSAAGPRALVRR